jgi:sulfur carrier protein
VNVVINGEPTAVPEGATVAIVMADLDLPASGRGVAVAVDREVIPRGAWERTTLGDGSRVEVVRAVQGG